MNPEKLTNKFKSALNDAQSLALSNDHQFIESTHVLLAMLEQQGGSIRPLIIQAGANAQEITHLLQNELKSMPSVSGVGGDVQISNDLSKLLNLTEKLALQRKDGFISSELFLLAVCTNKGQLNTLLQKAGITQQSIEQAIANMRGGETVQDENAEDQRNALKWSR